MKNAIYDIIRALVAFEVIGDVQIRNHITGRFVVTVNDEYYGVWDEVKKTFVD